MFNVEMYISALMCFIWAMFRKEVYTTRENTDSKTQVVFEYAKDRAIVFSSFQPDAALLVRKLQNTYPVSNLSCLFLRYLCCSLDHKQVKKLSPNDCCLIADQANQGSDTNKRT